MSREPDYDFDPEPVLRTYLQRINRSLSELSEPSFEILLQSWLSDLTFADRKNLETAAPWVLESGLFDAIKNGSVEVESSQ